MTAIQSVINHHKHEGVIQWEILATRLMGADMELFKRWEEEQLPDMEVKIGFVKEGGVVGLKITSFKDAERSSRLVKFRSDIFDASREVISSAGK